MPNNNPKISVVMSAYNRPQYVKEAIESILNQTYKDFEFIIVDDCSTDDTPDIIQGYADKDERIVFIKNPKNMDYNYNLRHGFEIAKGEYIARMDDDDISMPTRFEKQVKFLDENPDVTVLGTFIETFGNPDAKTWVTLSDSDEIEVAMNFYNPMCHPSVMIRNSFLKKYNLNYSPEELYAEEYHLWKEIILKGGKLANLPEELVKYRVHPKTVTRSSETAKIQDETSERVRENLLNRFYNNKKEVKKIRKAIFKYPFELNNKKNIENVLDKMKQCPKIISNEAIEKFQKRFLGKPCVMDIFFASDDRFSQHLCNAMTSILVNALSFENFNFYILDGGISDKNKRKIEKIKRIKDCKIEFIKVDDSLFDCCPLTKECRHISKQTYYRYIIPKLKPDLNKAFYFDCDIVVNDSLNAFWYTDLKDNYVAAVEELYFGASDDEKRLNITTEFNAGIILINLEKWKNENITEKLFENTKLLVKENNIKWVDQDVLNYTFNNKIEFVSPKYNLQCNAFFDGRRTTRCTQKELNDSKHAPVIVHFNSFRKPWNKHCDHLLWEQYYHYLKFSPYKSEYYKYKLQKYKNEYKYKFKKYLKEFGRIFYYKKKSPNKIKVRILGIPVYKRTNWDYTTKKYILGIRFYKKKNQFLQMQDWFNNKLNSRGWETNKSINSLEWRLNERLNTLEGEMNKRVNSLEWKLNGITQNLIQNITEENTKLKLEMNNEVSKALSVSNLHRQVFPKYKNINQGKDVVIVATGPTFNNYVPIEGAIHIGVNAACLQDKVKLDYLFVLDYKNIKSYIDTVINYRRGECKKFCGIFMNNLDDLNIPDCVAQKANAERYYLSYNNLNYDENFYPDITTSPLPSFWSTTFQALAFALWTNPKRIYLVGCDNNFNGHFDGTKQIIEDEEAINQHMIKTQEGWEKFKNFSKLYYSDTEIISINPVGLKGMFKDEYQEEIVLK